MLFLAFKHQGRSLRQGAKNISLNAFFILRVVTVFHRIADYFEEKNPSILFSATALIRPDKKKGSFANARRNI